jgi:hypothetical protein
VQAERWNALGIDQATAKAANADLNVPLAAFQSTAPQTPTATSGTQETMPLTDAEMKQRIKYALPAAKARIAEVLSSDKLTVAEKNDIQFAYNELVKRNTYINLPKLDKEGDYLGAAKIDGRGNGQIYLDYNSQQYFNSDNSINLDMLASVLVHEARHLYDARQYGNPVTLAGSRRTERNAYRTQAAFNKAIDYKLEITDLDGIPTILAEQSANKLAENSVIEFVKDYNAKRLKTNAESRQYNAEQRRIYDEKYSAYLREYAEVTRRNRMLPDTRRLPYPSAPRKIPIRAELREIVYSPPKTY